MTEGVPIRYGQAERWKSVRDRIGRTKPSRAPNITVKKRRRNDGRPPDTVKELLQKSASKKKEKQVAKLKEQLAIPTTELELQVPQPDLDGSMALAVVPNPIVPGPASARHPGIQVEHNTQPCYPWENNSCWLDVSLQLLFVALSRNFSEFSSLVLTIQEGHPLRTLHSIFEQRINLKPDEPNCPDILKMQRNNLRQQLIEHRQASHPTSFEPLMVCEDALQIYIN